MQSFGAGGTSSPDGTELYKMDATGANVVQLTIGPFQGGVDPDWQPLT